MEFCYDCGKGYDCEEPCCKCGTGWTTSVAEDEDPRTWPEDAEGLEAQLMVDDWPLHEKAIGNGSDDINTGCLHLQAMAAAGQSRCHGCLQIVDALKRCFNCQVELCVACRPQMPNFDLEL